MASFERATSVPQQMVSSWKTVSRLWEKYEGQRAAGDDDPGITSNRKNCGRKGTNVENLREALKDIPIRNRIIYL